MAKRSLLGINPETWQKEMNVLRNALMGSSRANPAEIGQRYALLAKAAIPTESGSNLGAPGTLRNTSLGRRHGSGRYSLSQYDAPEAVLAREVAKVQKGGPAAVAAMADDALARFLDQARFDPDQILQNASTTQTKRINEIVKEALEKHPKNAAARANFFRNKMMSDDTTKDLAKGAVRKGGLRGAWDKRMKHGLTKTDMGLAGVLGAAFLGEKISEIASEAQQRSAAIEMMQQQAASISPQDIATEQMLPVMLSRAMGGRMAPPTASGEYLTLGG